MELINRIIFEGKRKSLSNLIHKYILITTETLENLIKQNLYISNAITKYPMDLTIENLVFNAIRLGYAGFWIDKENANVWNNKFEIECKNVLYLNKRYNDDGTLLIGLASSITLNFIFIYQLKIIIYLSSVNKNLQF